MALPLPSSFLKLPADVITAAAAAAAVTACAAAAATPANTSAATMSFSLLLKIVYLNWLRLIATISQGFRTCFKLAITGGSVVEHWAVTREVVSSTPAGPTLRVLK